MPPFVQFLAGVFLVLPGFAMWALGLLALFVYSSMAIWMSDDTTHLLAIASILGFVMLMILVGYSMMAAYDVLTTKARYDIPARHVVPCVALELLVQTLAAVSFAISFNSFIRLFWMPELSPWLWGLLSILGFGGCVAAIWIQRDYRSRREKWKAAHAATLPQP